MSNSTKCSGLGTSAPEWMKELVLNEKLRENVDVIVDGDVGMNPEHIKGHLLNEGFHAKLDEMENEARQTLAIPAVTPLDVIIGTYTDAEIEEYIDNFSAKIEDLTAEKKQFELALSLCRHYKLSDELEKRIAAIQATGLVFTGFDEQGNEVWVSKALPKLQCEDAVSIAPAIGTASEPVVVLQKAIQIQPRPSEGA